MKMRMSFVRFELLSRKVSLKLPTCHIGQQDGEEDHHGEKGGDRDVQRIPAARGHLQAGKHTTGFLKTRKITLVKQSSSPSNFFKHK